uniref:E3 ubiquitin-protein ligase DTX3L-like n=1 Tax=Styela clava TaxID=7725 RepID=UPI00193A5DC5|nr:E3 ubiquitin-protein ligase DTX3L-like [Styela clava]
MSTLRVGTDGWRAPEIYFSDICSKQSDIFSSALVIHFISTDGSHPFGNDPDSWNLNIKRYQGCDLSKLEGDLEDLVGWMLRFRPQNRPNTEQIRKHKYFHGQLVCPYPKLSSVVRRTPEKEVVKVKEEFEERMKQMELKNEQEKTRMLKEMENLIKKTKEEEIVKVRRESERMRKEHEEEMRRIQKEKRKMEIENEKLRAEKKDFAQPSNISATNQLAVSTSANKSISQKTAKVKCQGAESQSPSQTTSDLRVINQQPPGGKLSENWLLESLSGYEGRGTLAITYSFAAGSLMGVSYEAQEFTEYLPWDVDGLICYNLLYQAFSAGLIFKIQKVGDKRGKIVWNDEFPHKTNKTGGPENNGYPDPNHTRKLQRALEAKGFKYDIWWDS